MHTFILPATRSYHVHLVKVKISAPLPCRQQVLVLALLFIPSTSVSSRSAPLFQYCSDYVQ